MSNSSAQQPDAYFRQVSSNLAREEEAARRDAERQRLHQRGRTLAGFLQTDRRNENRGFVWEQTRAPSWPSELPGHGITKITTAITADRTARGALTSAEQAFAVWQQQHQAATPERARVKYDELTEDLLPAAQRAADQLDRVLTAAAVIVEAIEARQAAERAAPRQRAAIEREYQAKLEALDRDLATKRMDVQQAIGRF